MAKHRICDVGPFLFLGLSFFAAVTYAAGNRRNQSILGFSNEALSGGYSILNIITSVVTLIACLVCAACFGFEAFDVTLPLPRRLRHARQQLLTYGPGIAVLVSALISLGRLYPSGHGSQPSGMLSVDPDIGGRGVLTAFYIPVLSTCASLILGHFQGMDAGTKELGMVLVSNLLCLTINMWIKASSLNFLEVAIACTCMDLTSSALSMTFSNKGALAHRLYVCISLVVQFIAFWIMTANLIRITTLYSKEGCGSSKLICNATKLGLVAKLILRICLWAHSVWLIQRLSPRMHDAEHMATKNQGAKWWLVPATATTQYLQWLPLAVMDICLLELLASYAKPVGEGNWSDWGQSQSLLTAIIAMLYSGWVVCHSVLKIEAAASKLPLGPFTNTIHGKQKWRLYRIPQAISWQSQNLSPVDYIRFQPELWDASARQERTDLSASPLNNVIRHMGKELRGAARMGDSKLATDLIDQGTDVDSMDINGWTPLMIAVENGHQEVCRILLEKGARATLHGVNIFGKSSPPSPVHVAVLHERFAILKHFAAQDPHVHELSSSVPRNAFSDDFGEDDDTISALCLAVKRDYTDGIRSLLDPDALLVLAMGRSDADMVREVLAKLFTKKRLQGDPSQGTWLHQNLSKVYIPAWDFDEGSEKADEEEEDNEDYDGIRRDRNSRQWVQILRLFEEAGTPMHAEDGEGRTLLHIAADGRFWPWIQPLTRHVTVNTKDNNGLTALHYAARAFSGQCVDELLRLGAAVSAQDPDGNTPLGHALRSYGNGHLFRDNDRPVPLVATLAARGINLISTNKDGHRPVDLLWQGFENLPPMLSLDYQRTYALFENCCLLYNLLLNAGSPPAYSVPEGPQVADEDAAFEFDIEDLRRMLRPSDHTELDVNEEVSSLATSMHRVFNTCSAVASLQARR